MVIGKYYQSRIDQSLLANHYLPITTYHLPIITCALIQHRLPTALLHNGLGI